MKRPILALIPTLMVVGCVTQSADQTADNAQPTGSPQPEYVYLYDRTNAGVSAETYSAKISVVRYNDGIKGFRLQVINKTDKSIEVDWDRTRFIDRGQTLGGFFFDSGLKIETDYVFANSKFEKRIFPNDRVISSEYYDKHLIPVNQANNQICSGDYGVSLVLSVNGKEVTQNLTLGINLVDTKTNQIAFLEE